MRLGPRHRGFRGERVLVTGATGFVGSAVARVLAGQGAEVHALVRRGADRARAGDVPITWHEGDIGRPLQLNGLIRRMTCVIHAAGRLGEAGVREEVYQQVNGEGTRNVLAAAMEGCEGLRVIHISSPGVLGPVAGAEEVAHEFIGRGLPVIIVRPEFIYGPADRHVLALFRAVRSGRFFYIDGGRHYCHPTFIDDAVNGILSCLRRGIGGQTYHITGPRPVTFRELIETMAAVLGVRRPRLSVPRWFALGAATCVEIGGRLGGLKAPLTRSAVRFFSEDRRFSWRKAHEDLHYSPQHDIASGISLTCQWYRARGWL
jgi:nucleoside-diphosphate-sugar epimerase